MRIHKHSIRIFWILIGITLVLAGMLLILYKPSNIWYAGIPNLSEPTSSKLTILIGGDVMLDRSIRKYGDKHGYDSLFANIIPLIKKADVSIVNLEGPITSSSSRTLLSNGATTKSFAFTFATSTGELLSRLGIDYVNLANNHTDNYGPEGLEETKNILENSGIGYFGDPWNASGTEATLTKNDIRIAFVGYHQFQPGFDRIKLDIERLSDEGYFVIVMPHWGVEYATTSDALQQKQARELVSAGANAIIGAHPHVIQNNEMIGSVPVYYSLGNLLFDQYFSDDVMQGNIIGLHLIKDGKGVRISKTILYETANTPTGVTIKSAQEY